MLIQRDNYRWREKVSKASTHMFTNTNIVTHVDTKKKLFWLSKIDDNKFLLLSGFVFFSSFLPFSSYLLVKRKKMCVFLKMEMEKMSIKYKMKFHDIFYREIRSWITDKHFFRRSWHTVIISFKSSLIYDSLTRLMLF